ncbi:sensor histidine kinase [Herbiconiux liukaitaii]|uniref:sensor histidine kinase n=1 Tax=Herbiconiux liukaitaii TaxID=3342799 RepID=UPI0035B8EA27
MTDSRGAGTGAGIGTAERSVRRILVVDAALLMLLVVAVHITFVARGGQPDYPLWTVSLSWFAASATLLAGLLARIVTDAVLGSLALIAVVAYWLTLVTFPFAVPAEGIDRIPWTLSATGAAAAAALVAGGRSLAWVTVAAGAAAGLVYRSLFGGLDLVGVVNDLQALLTGAVICVIGGHILLVGRGLDAAAASTTAAAARESAARGRLTARTRASALVHDEVLATLSLAASGLPIPRARLADQAQKAAAMVTRLTDEQSLEPAALHAAIAEEARLHDAAFALRDETTPGGPRPSAAVHEAFVGATRQALRNSVRHAPGASRGVVLTQTDDGIRVEIADDGPGFDPAGIADDRLGIRQSIVGRMERVEGGRAEIDSAPGRGAVVRLHSRATRPAAVATAIEQESLRVGFVAIAVVYVLTQAVCALLAAIAEPRSWPVQLAMFATALLAAEILRQSPSRVPGRRRTAAVVALVCGGLVAGAAAARFSFDMTFSYGTLWFAVAFAFLFVAIALRGRIVVALIGMVVIVAVLVTTGMLSGASSGQILQLSVRPVVLVGLAVALLVVVERMQRRIAALHLDAVASTERESWTLAARTELTSRVAELARTAVPLLARIGEGREPSEAERREYASCEGELRDGLRAGSLAREPLSSAVAAARGRGVDVLLLDDSGGAIDDRHIDPILTWLVSEIATAESRAVGRLLPPGREALVSLSIDGRQVHQAASPAQGSVMSFHGE